MNISILTGNLTEDPKEIKTGEKTLCKFSLAVNENYTRADGTRPCEFYNIICWGGLADVCVKSLKKGAKVAVVGKFQTRKYEKDGENKYVTEFVATECEFLKLGD